MQGVPQGAPFMFSGSEMTHCAVDGGEMAAEPACARRGVLRGGLRLRLARPLDPLNLKRLIPAKETSKVAHGAPPVSPSGVRFGWAPTPMRLPARMLPFFLGATVLLRAQVTPPGAPLTLDRYVVTGVPLEQSVNPITRETSAVMGDARGPLDTPRSVSTITAALVNERAIHGLRDILEYSPGAYAPSSYGELTVPYIRGDMAEGYVNGERRMNNEYGFLPSFNGVEAVDVVRGAGSAVFGAGYLTGGYVNYQTKQPKFSGAETTVTARLGTWTTGGLSYFNGSVQVDSTAPVNDRLAWRVSYEGKGGDTFYSRNGDKDDREDLFAALAWRPRPGLTFDFNAQWMWQNTNETLGVNHVNQDLIDHDLYYTGLSADRALK